MNTHVLREARALVARLAGISHGACASTAEIGALAVALGDRLPVWLADLLCTVPLCGLEFDVPAVLGRVGEREAFSLEWLYPEAMADECLRAHPGKAILKAGFVCVAGCSVGTGDQYFVDTRKGDDPPVFQFDHESGPSGADCIAAARAVAPSLSALLRAGRGAK